MVHQTACDELLTRGRYRGLHSPTLDLRHQQPVDGRRVEKLWPIRNHGTHEAYMHEKNEGSYIEQLQQA